MSIPAGGEIGLESHPRLDQFLRIESGLGLVKMGQSRDLLNYQSRVSDGYAVMVPAGTWHNIINIGKEQAKIIATAVTPNIKTYIESHRAEYEAWLKERKVAEIIITPPKKAEKKGA